MANTVFIRRVPFFFLAFSCCWLLMARAGNIAHTCSFAYSMVKGRHCWDYDKFFCTCPSVLVNVKRQRSHGISAAMHRISPSRKLPVSSAWTITRSQLTLLVIESLKLCIQSWQIAPLFRENPYFVRSLSVELFEIISSRMSLDFM
jgi:hypothetical protein